MDSWVLGGWLIVAGTLLTPVAAIVATRGLLKAKRAGEPIWRDLTGLVLSFPPLVFILLVFASSQG